MSKEEIKKINFSSSANTYKGAQIAALGVLIFILVLGAILTIATFDPNHLGGEVSGDGYWVVVAVILIFLLIVGSFFNDTRKNWPICPKHNRRLVIIDRKDVGKDTIITFQCSEKDYTTQRLTSKPKKEKKKSRFGLGIVGIEFGAGRSGGGGAGR